MPDNSHTLDTSPLDDGDEPAVRRARVVRRYRAGRTFEQIGTELGVSRQRAHQIYWEAMDAVIDREVSSRRAEMADQLDEVMRVASAVMAADHIAHSNGRVVTLTDPDTGDEVPVLDHAPKLDAGRTIIAAQARLSKMIGADAATKVESEVSVLRYEVAGIEPGDVV
jgi:hypothetical protein